MAKKRASATIKPFSFFLCLICIKLVDSVAQNSQPKTPSLDGARSSVITGEHKSTDVQLEKIERTLPKDGTRHSIMRQSKSKESNIQGTGGKSGQSSRRNRLEEGHPEDEQLDSGEIAVHLSPANPSSNGLNGKNARTPEVSKRRTEDYNFSDKNGD